MSFRYRHAVTAEAARLAALVLPGRLCRSLSNAAAPSANVNDLGRLMRIAQKSSISADERPTRPR
jgi:hypothetical protein